MKHLTTQLYGTCRYFPATITCTISIRKRKRIAGCLFLPPLQLHQHQIATIFQGRQKTRLSFAAYQLEGTMYYISAKDREVIFEAYRHLRTRQNQGFTVSHKFVKITELLLDL